MLVHESYSSLTDLVWIGNKPGLSTGKRMFPSQGLIKGLRGSPTRHGVRHGFAVVVTTGAQFGQVMDSHLVRLARLHLKAVKSEVPLKQEDEERVFIRQLICQDTEINS